MKSNFLRRPLVAGIVAAALVACGGAPDQDSIPLDSGITIANMDTEVRPQDDFFSYVNGGWVVATEIPADKSSYGAFTALREDAEVAVRGIIERAGAGELPEGTADAQKMGTLYNSFMNEERVEALGITPLRDDLKRIDRIDNTSELTRHFAWSTRAGVSAPISFSIAEDYKTPTRYMLYLGQSGLGLPNSDYYADDSERGQEIQAAYRAYLAGLLKRLDYDEQAANEAVAAIYSLEEDMAAVNRPPESNREYTRWYNLHGPDQAALPEGIAWGAYLAAFGIDPERVISLSQPEYFDGLATLVNDIPLETWKHYLRVRLLSASAPYLDEDLQQKRFAFYSQTLYGIPEQRPRWKRGVSLVNAALGDAVAQVYVAENFPPEAKQRMDELVQNLMLAYQQSIENLEWMSPETRERALEKLAKFTPNIGYPKEWKDYSSLSVGEDLVPNVRASNAWDLRRELDKLDGPVDRNEWFMTPQTVNAYYYSLQNSITFPAAILQPPFFNMAADDAVNYGAIGAVIGHEIGHGFDDNGSQFDGDGRLQNWWTDADRESFKVLTGVLIEQFDAYEVLPGVNVSGTLTQGENIGDLAGVSIAFEAYRKSLGGKPSPVLDGYTGEQRFFIGFAQAFLNKARDERKRQLVKIDTHSPAEFRVNGTVGNVPAFYDAFDVKEGDALYRPPELRVKIW